MGAARRAHRSLKLPHPNPPPLRRGGDWNMQMGGDWDTLTLHDAGNGNHCFPTVATISHIGRKMPRARTSTMPPTQTMRMGSMAALMFLSA